MYIFSKIDESMIIMNRWTFALISRQSIGHQTRDLFIFVVCAIVFVFIRLIFHHKSVCPFIQISWTRKTFDVDLRFLMRNRVHMVSSIIFPSRHLTHSLVVFFKMLSSRIFLSSHHISYELSNKCRFPRSIDRTHSFVLIWLDDVHGNEHTHMGRKERMKKIDICVCVVHTNNLIALGQVLHTSSIAIKILGIVQWSWRLIED